MLVGFIKKCEWIRVRFALEVKAFAAPSQSISDTTQTQSTSVFVL